MAIRLARRKVTTINLAISLSRTWAFLAPTFHFLFGFHVHYHGHDKSFCHLCLYFCLWKHVAYVYNIQQIYARSYYSTAILYACGQVLSVTNVKVVELQWHGLQAWARTTLLYFLYFKFIWHDLQHSISDFRTAQIELKSIFLSSAISVKNLMMKVTSG